nr:MAG TPA: hypothetical protein [Caudoviricetes sp.]
MYGKFNIKIKSGKATLDRDIFLSKKDKDIVLYFTVDGFPYKFSNGEGIEGASYSQITLEKPNKTRVVLPKTAVDINEIILKVTEDIVDEVVEIGDYNFQIKLFGKDNSEIHLPIIYNQFHVNPIIDYSEDTSSGINQGGIGNSHITIGDSIEIFDANKRYNKTTWHDKDTITAQKMNKIEDALYYSLDNLVVNKLPVNGEISLSLDRYQSVTTDNDLVIKLPSIDFHNEFILYINTLEVIYATFRSAEKDYVYRLARGYYKCRLSYIGTWLVEIIMDNNNIDFDGFASEKDIKDLQDSVKTTLTDFKNNCDKKYADINHTHNNYIEKINETKGLLVKEIDGYKGMITEDGNETRAIRTTKEGLIPYERGISSSLGSEEYRFDKAYVNKADINEVNSVKNVTDRLDVNGDINVSVEGKIDYSVDNSQFEMKKNGEINNSRLALGCIEINGIRIYTGSEFPSDARENDILIKIEGISSGGSTTPSTDKYVISNNLTNVITNNDMTSIEKNKSYSAKLTAYNGYTINSIVVTMGGTNITSTSVANNTINISKVTGNVIITASATLTTTTTVPNPVFELNASNFTSGANKWVDLVGDKSATINGTVQKVNGRVRFNGDKYFLCNVSSLNLNSYTVVAKISVNPTNASVVASGDNIVTLGAGTGNWTDNMACNIMPSSTVYQAIINGDNVTGKVATGEIILVMRCDSTKKQLTLNVGDTKYEGTYTRRASSLRYLYNATNSYSDYEYIKVYDSVLTDSQISNIN